jgi:hypothetical protein
MQSGAVGAWPRCSVSVLHGVQLFIGFDDGSDGWKGDSGDGQVLVEATRALFWWPLGTLQFWRATNVCLIN